MEFVSAIREMEKGALVRRPHWKGYLFMDIDDNIKHAGGYIEDDPEEQDEATKNKNTEKNEKHWRMDCSKKDWEVVKETDKTSRDEISVARIETLMECNSSHIKRLYWLEDLIKDQYKIIKKLSEDFEENMISIRRSVRELSKSIPEIKSDINSLVKDIYANEIKGLIRSSKRFMEMVERERKEKKSKNPFALKDESPITEVKPSKGQMTDEEKKEMKDVRKKLELRKKNSPKKKQMESKLNK